ncbi:MAG TPA: SDR family oxidoreductase [Gemmatimonadaceae bacterium]|jgi:NAD(P)-dependent dehydrogenase (short-subunit alcohol dehydrogenase family)
MPARKASKTTKKKTAPSTTDRHPKPPFPKQSQRRPGIEGRMSPRPQFLAPEYRGAGRLAGRVAIITGGDSGIGRSVAVLFAREGANVAIVYTRPEQSDALETQSAIENEGASCLLIPGDVRNSAFCDRAVQRTVKRFGRLDILVNNAAFQQHQKSIEDLTNAQLERTFRTNIFGYFFMARAAIPEMKPGSAIINTGSITGLDGSKELLDYSATKGAIHAFTKSLAQNLVEKRIRVNCVAPGPIWTPLNVVDKPPRAAAKHGGETPMERPGQPEEVAPSYVFFASNADSSYITGEVLTLLGGETTAG